MASRNELPSTHLGSQLLSEFAHRAFDKMRKQPSRIVGITISKLRDTQDFIFDEPINLAPEDDIDAIIERQTGKSRSAWETEGFTIDINGS